ncbi:MAG: phenylalanine--tRNA ligase subunit beta [Candidatus Saccharibacteria bacterium]|nr:phenylalanine--tRNA ligase subunit beta [Candidatus Saccharibacteria bacterium]
MMIISVNWLKQYVDIDDVPALVDKIGARLVEVEEVTALGDKYRAAKATIVKVISCIEHPDSDHLHICQIDDGGVNIGVPRDDDGYVQVVCGAPNIATGQTVVWLPPTAIVPESYDTDDEFRLSARKLRGVLSQGMIASPRELGLWNEHEGIMVLDDQVAKAGDQLIDVLDLDDYLIEVENKSLTHRPDCFGVIGFAREVAAIMGRQIKTPDWFNRASGQVDNKSNVAEPTVTIADPNLCARYECVVLDNVDSSRNLPVAMRGLIARSGSNSISAPVDATNYLMFETGQPLHAFDFDKVITASPTGKADIVVRASVIGEELELLDGRIIKLDPADVVIAVGDNENSVPIALAGAMGGMATEITASTKRVLLESATFNLYKLRGTQFRHGIFSEAVTRFTKGQPAGLTHPVLLRAAELLQRYAGATVISGIVDNYPSPFQPADFVIPVSRFADILGVYGGNDCGYDDKLITRTLNNLQYSDVRVNNGTVQATAPWWRTDLHIDEDVIEDVGRVNGYDDIVSDSPLRRYEAASYDQLYKKQMWLRDRLQMAGGNEIVTYSFVHGDLLDKVGDDRKQAFRIVNAISPNLQYYRRDLVPGMLELARDNLRSGYDNFMLFELGKVHRQGIMETTEPLPAEIQQVAGVIVDKKSRTDSPYYTAKKVVDYVLAIDPAELVYTRMDQSDVELDSSTNLYEPTRSAVLTIVAGGETAYVGVVGELRASVRKQLKLPEYVAAFSLLIDELLPYLDDDDNYTPILRYQGTSRDITYQVSVETTYGQVLAFTKHTLADLLKHQSQIVCEVSPLDIYRPDESSINVTLHIDFHDRNQTIDTELINKVMDQLTNLADKELSAKVI